MIRRCPADSELIRFASRETSARETDRMLGHLAVCSRCSVRYGVLQQLKRDLEPRVDAFVAEHEAARPSRPRPFAVLAGLRLAPVLALLALALGSGAYLAISRGGRHSDLRGSAAPLASIEPAGRISAPPAVLRWSPVPRAESYRLELIDDSLRRVHAGAAFLVNELVLPAEVRGALVRGRTYVWTVSALDADGNLLTSGSGSFVIE